MAIHAIGRPIRLALMTAGLMGLAAGSTIAGPLDFLPGVGRDRAASPEAQIVPVQAVDPYRVGQLEEQIRNLNGRIEELSFQLLQMQEQMRQMQEDNEFRFQSLEGGAPASDRSSLDGGPTPSAPAPSEQSAASTGSVTPPPGVETGTTASTSPAPGAAASGQTLGSITFDEQGNLSRTLDAGTNGANASSELETASLSADDPDQLYREAYNLVLSGDYAEAEAAFQDYVDIFPDGGHAADANFWLGESQYSQGSYNDAARTFLNAHQTYPDAEKAPEMLLKLGMSLAALDNRDTACATYREVLTRYPDATQTVRDKVAAEQRSASC
ncbi:tol-pal system protein YbgF [Pararhizobium haloflavum]|uniref:tol-pal system protein YbgF n=1 Tax=Pararhizobium haloflavum TaxID=2037914 RepID=UPI000C17F2D6|nr:tol-pal system protein YbgF [Pararhizobium haloflavum]